MDYVLNGVFNSMQKQVSELDYSDIDDIDAKLSDLGFDSLKLVSLMLELENFFSIEFPPELVKQETFQSITTIVSAVENLLHNN